MAVKEVFCPQCGNRVSANDGRSFCFCPECGNRIVLPSRASGGSSQPSATTAVTSTDVAVTRKDLENKLQEVEFYYQMSREKREGANLPSEPTYYLKAQDLLAELSSKYPDDYRVWWEFCKPVDYFDTAVSADADNQYTINDHHFNRALDCAPIETKRQIITERDRYAEEKRAAVEKRITERKTHEAALQAEFERRAADEREAQIAEQRRQAEEAERRAAEEQEEQRKAMAASALLWNALTAKDYSTIDNTCFELYSDATTQIIGVFKSASTMLYLIAYRIDRSKSAIFTDQSFPVRFSENGIVVKYDNAPVRVRGLAPEHNELVISGSGDSLYAAAFPLRRDAEYVKTLARKAKKPLIVSKKVFL